jgi:hypothetical protein
MVQRRRVQRSAKVRAATERVSAPHGGAGRRMVQDTSVKKLASP